MRFLDNLCKQLIGSIQILLIGNTVDIFRCITVFHLTGLQKITPVIYDLTDMRIDIIIILYIIFMIGRRYEKRIEINDIHAQILQIVHFLQNACQVTTVKFTHAHNSRIFSPVRYTVYMLSDISIFVCKHVIIRIAVIETINIDLIHDCTFCPGRYFLTGNQCKFIIILHISRHAAQVKKAIDFSHMDLKIIFIFLVIQCYFDLVIIKLFIL